MTIDISNVKINGGLLLKEVEEELSNEEWEAAKKELKVVMKELRAAELLVERLKEKRDRLIGREP
jgi:hypothetical protein